MSGMNYRGALFSLLSLIWLIVINFEPVFSQEAEWTIMIYMDADNDLEGAGIEDINEMEVVGSTSEINPQIDYRNALAMYEAARSYEL